MTFDEWLQIGVDNKWCGAAVCSTHDGVPMSDQEDAEFMEGDDPCVHILRLYEDEDVADAVNRNFTAYKWRFPRVNGESQEA